MHPDLRHNPIWWTGSMLLVLTLGAAGACRADGTTSTKGAAGSFRPVEPGVLTVVADLPAPGFWEVDDDGVPDGGFEYELALELADRFDLDDLTVTDRPFEDIVSGEHDDYDLALAQISDTPDRRRVLDLSSHYLETPVAALSLPGVSAPDLAAARDLRWGAVDATTEVDLVTDRIRPRDHDTKVYATTDDALRGLRDEEVDVVALDYLTALAQASAADDLVLAAEVTTPQHYAVALPDSSDNTEAVDSALRRLHSDGTLAEMADDLYASFDPDVDLDVPVLRLVSP